MQLLGISRGRPRLNGLNFARVSRHPICTHNVAEIGYPLLSKLTLGQLYRPLAVGQETENLPAMLNVLFQAIAVN